jgi:predicted DNA-binding transcriptional regulator AlpA
MTEEKFLDINEAAQFLRISPRTLYGWINRKKMGLPVRDHGRRKVFLASELKAWSDRQNGVSEPVVQVRSA